MEYVNLGRSGLKVSRICLGCMTYGSRSWRPWVLDEDEALPFYRRALELGITFFDTADMYSVGASEVVTGRAIREFASRDQVIIGTKVFWPMGKGPNDRGLSRKHILDAIDASLTRLGTDYVDLYQIHRWDNVTPIEETLRALEDIVRAGKARYLGASSMFAWQFAKALYTADLNGWTRFATMQNHLNLLHREEEREMIPFCVDQGVALLPWSPLARGRLTRDWDAASARQETDEVGKNLYDATAEADRKVVEAVARVAEARGVPRAQVALAWVLAQPNVAAPIVGASKPQHLDDAVAALDLRLTPEEIATLEGPYVPHAIVGFR